MDYLDKTLTRYRDSGNGPYEHPEGEWVKFADMDLYMFETGQLLIQTCKEIDRLRAAIDKAIELLKIANSQAAVSK
jgi:hypothetical protein